jgi:dTDP-4-amino-4,6-dideoxygalactose transaminase
LQAAILRVKLGHLDAWTAGRQSRAARYRQKFHDRDLTAFLSSPEAPDDNFHHIYNQFTIRCPFRDELKYFLRQDGIPTEIYYPLCLHLQVAFSKLGGKIGDFPVAEKASGEVLSLPVYSELSDEQQDRVINSIDHFRSQKA